MIFIGRAARQSVRALGAARAYATAAARTELPEYEAESSSAPHRRQAVGENLNGGEVASNREAMAEGTGNSSQANRRNNHSVQRERKLSKAKRVALALRTAQNGGETESKQSFGGLEERDITGNGGTGDYAETSIEGPTVQDLIAYRPHQELRDFERWDPRYVSRYNQIQASIDNAFVRDQLARMTVELGLPLRTGKRVGKFFLIRGILTSWGWPTPTAPPFRDTANVEKEYPLTAAESFFFVRDQARIRSAIPENRLSFNFVRKGKSAGSSIATVLSARGEATYHQQLSDMFKESLDSLKSTTFPSTEIGNLEAPPELLHAVSNLTGAYVEMTVDGTYRISSLSEESLERARVSLEHAALQISTSPKYRSLVALTPSSSANAYRRTSDDIALIPFTPSISSTLPWFSVSSFSNPLFRLRKIGKWAVKHARREVEQRDEKLAAEAVTVLRNTDISTIASTDEVSNLESLLSGLMESRPAGSALDEGDQRLIATFGHIVLPAQTEPETSLLSSPLPGRVTIVVARNWLEEKHVQPFFVPTLTPAMIHFGIDGPSTTVRRLRYVSTEVEDGPPVMMIFTLSRHRPTFKPHPQTETPLSTASQGIDQPSDRPMAWQDELEQMLKAEGMNEVIEGSVSNPDAAESVEVDVNEGSDRQREVTETPGPTVIVTGEREVLSEIDLMIPDRSIDSRFTSVHYRPIPADQIPESISSIAENLCSRTTVIGSADSVPTLHTPPSTIQSELDGSRKTYRLFLDEEQEIIEQVVPVTLEEGEESKEQIILRRIKSTEQGLSPTRATTYTELESTDGKLTPEFWRQLASISRDVDPVSAAFRTNSTWTL